MSYAWDFAEFGTCGGPDTAITFPNDIERFYPVQLILTNELGCADTIRRSAPVEDQFLICVPNALSPDGDGRKETYFVEGKDHNADGFELIVFDRSGSEIYAATDPSKGWTGANNGGSIEPRSSGILSWQLTAGSTRIPDKRKLRCHVTLLR